jgi:hypothetical protein
MVVMRVTRVRAKVELRLALGVRIESYGRVEELETHLAPSNPNPNPNQALTITLTCRVEELETHFAPSSISPSTMTS